MLRVTGCSSINKRFLVKFVDSLAGLLSSYGDLYLLRDDRRYTAVGRGSSIHWLSHRKSRINQISVYAAQNIIYQPSIGHCVDGQGLNRMLL